MTSKITPLRAMLFAKISVALVCAWPLSPEATKSRVFLFKAWWCASYINSILLLLPLLNSVYLDREYPEIMGKSLVQLVASLQIAIKLTICHVRYEHLQSVYHEMETFCKRADDRTNVMLQRYVDDYKRSYGVFIVWCYAASIGVICGPLVLPESFPSSARYPFRLEHTAVKSIIYFQQSLVALQTSSGMCIDASVAFLLFFSIVRFELLSQRIRVVTDELELDACIELHDKILRYTTKVTSVVTPLVFATIVSTATGVVFAALNIAGDEPMIVKIQYAVVSTVGAVEVFMCAWPADNLMHMSMKICDAAYESRWFQENVSMRRKIFHIIFRSQRPQVIRISGVLPVLSLRYYAAFLYTTSSYFAAVRMIVNENAKK